MQKLIAQRDRYHAQFLCAYHWLVLLEQETSLIPYFEDRQCSTVAVYGAAALGRMLVKELRNKSSISVSYYMDRNAVMRREIDGLWVYLPEELQQAPEVDMMVVTAVTAFDPVSRGLLEIRPEMPVISLETIINARISEEWK